MKEFIKKNTHHIYSYPFVTNFIAIDFIQLFDFSLIQLINHDFLSGKKLFFPFPNAMITYIRSPEKVNSDFPNYHTTNTWAPRHT